MGKMIQFEGDDKFIATLEKAMAESERTVDAVIKNNAERTMRKAKQLAPVDTWFMHDTIYTEYAPLTGMIHSPAAYSGYQEYGTRFMGAQPFMRPAMDWMAPKYAKDLRDVIRGTLRRG